MQKELLDTELDLYKKIQAGEGVAELRKKYMELQLEVCVLFIHFGGVMLQLTVGSIYCIRYIVFRKDRVKPLLLKLKWD